MAHGGRLPPPGPRPAPSRACAYCVSRAQPAGAGRRSHPGRLHQIPAPAGSPSAATGQRVAPLGRRPLPGPAAVARQAAQTLVQRRRAARPRTAMLEPCRWVRRGSLPSRGPRWCELAPPARPAVGDPAPPTATAGQDLPAGVSLLRQARHVEDRPMLVSLGARSCFVRACCPLARDAFDHCHRARAAPQRPTAITWTARPARDARHWKARSVWRWKAGWAVVVTPDTTALLN